MIINIHDKGASIMQSAPQELLKQYVQSQHFTSTADIMEAMKEMFRDVIQQVMEVEMDEELGRERCQRAAEENASPNYRNGYSQKTVKTQLGEIDIKVPRDRKGNYETKIIGKYDRTAEGREEKSLSLYACWMRWTSLRSWSARFPRRSCRRSTPGRIVRWKAITPLSSWMPFTTRSRKITAM